MVFTIFLLWLFVLIARPQDFYHQIASLRPALILTIATLGLVFFRTTRAQIAAVFESKEGKLYTLFYLAMIIGIPFAYHRRIAFDYVFLLYLVNIFFFYIFVLQVTNFDRLRKAMIMLLFASLFFGVFSMISGAFIGGRYFVSGSMYDPNDIAYVLISLFPLSFYFVIGKGGYVFKVLAFINIGMSISIILLTGSRGGILGLLTVLGLLFFTNIGKLKRSHKLLFVSGLVGVALYYANSINVERYLTITHIGQDYNVTQEFGRFDIWEKSLELFISNPITGVGVNCSGMAIGYLRDALGLIPRWQPTHNSYIQVALEIGIIGAYLFFSLIYYCIANFNRYRIKSGSSGEADDLSDISGLILIAFAGQLILAFFLTQAYSMFFTLFFALSVVIRKLSLQVKETEQVEIKTAGPLITQLKINKRPKTLY